MSVMNKFSYYPCTRATIVLLHRILTTATSLTAMTSPEGNITCKGIVGKPDKILPCM